MICDGCGTLMTLIERIFADIGTQMTLIERIFADIGTLMTLIERIGADGFSNPFCIAPAMTFFH